MNRANYSKSPADRSMAERAKGQGRLPVGAKRTNGFNEEELILMGEEGPKGLSVVLKVRVGRCMHRELAQPLHERQQQPRESKR